MTFLRDIESLLRRAGSCRLRCPTAGAASTGSASRRSLGRVVDAFRVGPTGPQRGLRPRVRPRCRHQGRASTPWKCHPHGRVPPTPHCARRRGRRPHAAAKTSTSQLGITPNHFRLLLLDLHALGFIGLGEAAYHETVGPKFDLGLSPDAPGPCCRGSTSARPAALKVQTTEDIDLRQPVGRHAPFGDLNALNDLEDQPRA